MCIFCKIIAGELPSEKVFENDEFIVIKDINPQAKVHLLAIPKEHYNDICELNDKRASVVGTMLKKLGEIASDLQLVDGFRIVCNKGQHACQSVGHLHIQLVGGQQLSGKFS